MLLRQRQVQPDLARKLDGSPASSSYFSRRRRVVHRALGYAARKKRLSTNPLSKASQPEGWTPPEAPDDARDYRAIGSPELVESMIEICRTLGSTQGARFQRYGDALGTESGTRRHRRATHGTG